MKAIIVAIVAYALSGSAIAGGPTYLECNVSSITTELLVTLNESTGKITQTYKANGSGFSADGQFNANEIIYERKVPKLRQSERFRIDRSTLAIEQTIYVGGEKVVDGNGTCKIVQPRNNKI
ncbi:MAG TPA: hypothetical protein VFL96_13060 [Acidobacteriaceae bacterium]|nr:hypothetical protein [Acidobacteriaceae bacterium]